MTSTLVSGEMPQISADNTDRDSLFLDWCCLGQNRVTGDSMRVNNW